MRTVTAASCQKGCFLRHRNEHPAAGIRVAHCCGGPRNFVRGTNFISQNKFHSRCKFLLACRCALPASAYCLAGPSCAATRDAHKFAQIHCCNFVWLPELCEGMNDLFERALRGERPQYIHLAAARSGETSRAAFNQLRLQRIGFVAHVPFAALSELTEVLGAPEL